MGKKILLVLVLAATSCGRSSVGTEAVGQVKRIVQATPIICPNRTEADLSLGVMRNGVGSMSGQDIDVVVERPEDVAAFKTAAISGALVKVTYDRYRFSPCTEGRFATKVEVIK